MSRLSLAAGVLALAAALAGCDGSGGRSTQPTPAVSRRLPSASATPTTSAVAGKAVLRGLLDRDGRPPAGYLGAAVSGWVVNARWADLQPTRDGPIATGNVIDRAIAEVRRENAAHPAWQLGLKLRVRAGVDAPAWAKGLAGGAVGLTEPQNGRQDSVGRFWTEEFGAAYADLQTRLAARYDAVPEIRETAATRCTTFFAEPFIRNRQEVANNGALQSAGFSTAADHACLQQMIDAHAAWRLTNSDVAFNPYQDLEKGRGRRAVDEAFTESMMVYCRGVLGPRCVLENNSLSSPPRYLQMYARMQQLGPPLSFQTATARKIGDLTATLRYAESLGAGSVELPVAYRQAPPAVLAPANAALRAD